ncbi:MAG: hypothetical protein QXT38_03465 [Candidatus Aenigmatarchaeota archaeon]
MAFNIPYLPGLYEFYLPFLLVFAVIYALLAKAKVFGEGKPGKVANLVISLAFGLYVAASPFSSTLIEYLINLFGQGMIVILTIVLVLMIFSLFVGTIAFKEEAWGGKALKYVFAFAAIVGLLLFFSSGGSAIFNIVFPSGLPAIDEGTMAGIVMVIITLGIIIFLMSSEKEEKRKSE